ATTTRVLAGIPGFAAQAEIFTLMGNAVLRTSGRALASVIAIAAVMSATAASAQDAEKEVQIAPKKVESKPAPAAAAKPAAPAAAAAAAAVPKSAWVKLCESAPLVKKDKDGKEVKEEKKLCLTH